jgi:UPF0176 protein
MTHEILLYYIYTHIDNPTAVMHEQRYLCERLGLKGRIIIANEGINGTVEGSAENTQKYIDAIKADALLANMTFKRSEGTGNAFPRLSVKARTEIVSAHLGEADVNPRETTGTYLSAEELHEWIIAKKEFYIVDMRNDYEHAVGHFAGSILPPMRHFRQLPEMLPQLEHLRNKTVVTVCTGGVRCEKASGFLVKNGFADVYQLKEGIVTYMEKYPNEDFHGKLYVFDGRITMGFNSDTTPHVVVGRCEGCGQPSERYINCADDQCHRHFICCENCQAGEVILCPNGCSSTRHQKELAAV